MLASVTMCNDNISNYNSKINDLGILHYRIMGDVGIEHRAVFLGGWGPSYTLTNSLITRLAFSNVGVK